jgi:hypothetical protein
MRVKINKMRLLVFAAVQISSAPFVYSGETVMTTSDQNSSGPGPTYGNGLEVVIQPGTTVTLTTGADKGVVSVVYTCSSGVSKTSDTGAGTQQEVAVFSFDSTTYGKINTININVSHTDDNDSDCNGQEGDVTFTICIPKITVPLVTLADTKNWIYWQKFYTHQTITGCDDFSQINFQQQLDTYTAQEQPGATAYSTSGLTGVYNNSNGWANDGAGLAPWLHPNTGIWQVNSSNNSTALINNSTDLDHHSTGPDTYNDVIVAGQDYSCANFWTHSAYFKDCIQRTTDSVVLSGCEFDWGYTWDNANWPWPNPPSAPAADSPSSYGGTGNLPSNHGEYTVYGITSP